jgi:hypothetical protein
LYIDEVAVMDELERMAQEAENFNRVSLDKKKAELQKELKYYDFKNLLDAVELLFELRAKREKSVKDYSLIKIIEDILREEPFEYMDEDYILQAYINDSSSTHRSGKRK